jgi:hypothetical protein
MFTFSMTLLAASVLGPSPTAITVLCVTAQEPVGGETVNPFSGPIDKLPQPKSDKVPSDLRIVSSLYKAARLAQTLEPAEVRRLLGESFMPLRDDGFFEVEIVAPSGEEPPTVEFVQQFGAIPDSRWRNYFEVHVPQSRLLDLARAIPRDHLIMRATAGEPDDVDGEGPGMTGSDSYRDGGANGSGKTIAVIDGGYDNLTEARANGDAPTTGSSTNVNYTLSSFESSGSGTHGTGCVEASFDHCPGATWRIYKVNSVADKGTAVDNGDNNGVDIFTHSLSSYNLGWGDNTGGACDAAEQAADDGALFFTSAGNRAQQHFEDTLSAPSEGSFHNFGGGDETINISIGSGGSANFYLSWNTSGGTHDLDMFLYNSSATTILASSEAGSDDYESFSWENTGASTVTVHLAIYRYSGGTPEFEVFGHGSGTWERFTSVGSNTSPSNTTDQDVISCAAVDEDNFPSTSGGYGTVMSYSSQGPTNSGNTVPDIAGPTNTAGFTYGAFGGTSSATPNTAGAACAFWSSVPNWSNSAVRWALFRHAISFKDWGASGNDNIFGYGGANLHPFESGTVWLARDWGNTTNASSGPRYTIQGAYNAVSNGGRILILEGSSYPELPSTMTKNIDIEIVDETAVLGS